jgi:hypothetical protein
MASARQVAANRRNASLPRGPLSEAASAAIRENAVKHGLTAKHVVLGYEDDASYQELRASILTEYQPQTPQEHRLADQIAQNYWRLLRSRRIETATFENRLGSLKDRLHIGPDTPMDHDEGLSVCMSKHARDFENLRRYETSIERAWYRAIRELKATQKERREAESQNPPPAEATPEPQKVFSVSSVNSVNSVIKDLPAEVSGNGIRCVSQDRAQPGNIAIRAN